MAFRHLVPGGLTLLLLGCSHSTLDATPAPQERPRATVPSSAPKAATTKSSSSDSSRPPSKTAAELVGQALQASRDGDLAGAIALVEKAVALAPNDRAALVLWGTLLQQRAGVFDRPQNSPLYLRSAEAFRRLRAAHPDLSPGEASLLCVALYNEACTYAVQGKPEKALDVLAEAIDAGFLQLDSLHSDEELQTLRTSKRFRELVTRAEQQARAEARTMVRRKLAESPGFPLQFTLSDQDGKPVTLAEVRGKVTIVVLWGTWCPPCRRQVPHLADLFRREHNQGLEVLGLNYELPSKQDEKDTVAVFVKEHGIPYRCLIGDEKTLSQIPNFQGFPTTLFLDQSGTVRAVMMGFEPGMELEMEEIVAALFENRPTQSIDEP